MMFTDYEIRRARLSDLSQIMDCINDAKKLLRDSGSKQWNISSGYPNEDTFIKDICDCVCYVALFRNTICGVVSICPQPEQSYENNPKIWSTKTYYSVHRLALLKHFYHKGVAVKLMEFAEELAKENNIEALRVDTHTKNSPMKGLLAKLNYQNVGIIELTHTKEDNLRLAYEKRLNTKGIL